MAKSKAKTFDYVYLIILILSTLMLGIHFGTNIVIQHTVEGLSMKDVTSGVKKMKNKTVRTATNVVGGADSFVGGMTEGVQERMTNILDMIGLK